MPILNLKQKMMSGAIARKVKKEIKVVIMTIQWFHLQCLKLTLEDGPKARNALHL